MRAAAASATVDRSTVDARVAATPAKVARPTSRSRASRVTFIPGIQAASPASGYSPMAPAIAGARVRKYTGKSKVCASLKVRAVAPSATKAAAKSSAAGRMTTLLARALPQGTSSTMLCEARRRTCNKVMAIEPRLRTPVRAASVATASTLPSIRSKRRMGEQSTVSRVPRSRSPAVTSMAG